ncbi:hypothetical protein ACGK9R_08145 [Halomonas sp. HNIBRBA4712]|uniref:hypothetical protein n=1 Tax=Halomonas sp. HNIBRBA4712 TaxID=3373087 RepID=UPI0037467F5B
MAKRFADAAPGCWEVVELEAFSTPKKTRQSRRQRYLNAIRIWLNGKRDAERQAMEEKSLRKLPELRLAHLVPPIDWRRAAAPLNEAITRGHADEPVVFFITPPHGGHASIVREWARTQAVAVCEAPNSDALLEGRSDWIAAFDGKPRWALPDLEHCFLRNRDGVQGVRAFLQAALTGQLGQGVIGCDSWSYAYLKHLVGLDSVPTLTLQALEGDQLAAYFLRQDQHGLTVYSTRTGKPLIGSEHRAESELEELAAYCRGHLGVAWHYWRERLREPAPDIDEKAKRDDKLWLVDALNDAELTSDTGDVAVLTLHSLLIHGGLDDQALCKVLPFSDYETLNARLTLARLKVVDQFDQRWQVTPLSYTSVRELLASRNYLVDPL